MTDTAICLGIGDPVLFERVAGALSRFGYRTVNCADAVCPSGASAVVTDRPGSSCCRRAWGISADPHATGSCEVPLIRIGRLRLPEETGDAFATIAADCSEEELLIAVTRAVRYGQHLAAMQSIRGASGA